MDVHAREYVYMCVRGCPTQHVDVCACICMNAHKYICARACKYFKLLDCSSATSRTSILRIKMSVLGKLTQKKRLQINIFHLQAMTD